MNVEQLEQITHKIESNMENYERINKGVSAKSVGWQLDHLMLVINRVVEATATSKPEDYSFQFRPIRYYIMLKGKIPRGKAPAPKEVRPDEEVSVVNLEKRLEVVKKNVQRLKKLQKNQYFHHPLFGNMKVKPTIQFLKIHSQHHLDIIEDIIQS